MGARENGSEGERGGRILGCNGRGRMVGGRGLQGMRAAGRVVLVPAGGSSECLHTQPPSLS